MTDSTATLARARDQLTQRTIDTTANAHAVVRHECCATSRTTAAIQARSPWAGVLDGASIVGSLGTAFAVGWAVMVHYKRRDERRIAVFESRSEEGLVYLERLSTGFQNEAAEMLSRVFTSRGEQEDAVAERVLAAVVGEGAMTAVDRARSIESARAELHEWFRYGMGSRYRRIRDEAAIRFARRASRLRFHSAVEYQAISQAALPILGAYKSEFREQALAGYAINTARILLEQQERGDGKSAEQVRAAWRAGILSQMLVAGGSHTYVSVFNPIMRYLRGMRRGFEAMTFREKLATLSRERRVDWGSETMATPSLVLSALARIRFASKPLELDVCLKAAEALGLLQAEIRAVTAQASGPSE